MGTAGITALPAATPASIVCHLNRVMRLNIRERLEEEDHATFMMLRYRASGVVTMAGAHEDVVIYRAQNRKCELQPTDGVWIGITENIEAETLDRDFTLDPGDIMLLYTDGLIEARNAAGEEFDIERVMELLRASAEAPVSHLRHLAPRGPSLDTAPTGRHHAARPATPAYRPAR